MSKFPYCEKCLKQPHRSSEQYDFYDYRFDFPVCFVCVSDYDLVPEKEED
jgi:hypothetical protein